MLVGLKNQTNCSAISAENYLKVVCFGFPDDEILIKFFLSN